MQGKIVKVSGALVVAVNMTGAKLYDVCLISEKELVGEIIELRDDKASIEVYENTDGLKVGDIVVNTNLPLSIQLGPGLIGNVLDGIGRSLKNIYENYGDRIKTGAKVQTLSTTKKWQFVAKKKVGDFVSAGDILGVVKEGDIIEHKIMVPVNVSGKLTSIKSGSYTVSDTVAKIKTDKKVENVGLSVMWPIRIQRPYKRKIAITTPLITGQRVIDTFFPIAFGGTAAIPGPFGSGKTVVQHQLAKWSNADVVVYVGCGERGNEMTEVLKEFPTLLDPKTKKSLMEKTILVANTSDMPVAAREASIYTGITIAEYYRDMGYNVIIMADSTSRWAEALREMSGRLEEIPGEEGYPAYLGSRIASFYERAGNVLTLGSEERVGSVSCVGAVSPQGGDLSEPVSQATLRIVKVFLGLSSALAYKRHFPAIDWLTSYSGYAGMMKKYYQNNLSYDFLDNKNYLMKVLQEERELNDVVSLMGFDVLGDKDKTTLDIAQVIREDYLHQNAFDEVDTYTSLAKQDKMLKCIRQYANLALDAVKKGIVYERIINISSRALIGKMKYVGEDELDKIDDIATAIKADFLELEEKEEQ